MSPFVKILKVPMEQEKRLSLPVSKRTEGGG